MWLLSNGCWVTIAKLNITLVMVARLQLLSAIDVLQLFLNFCCLVTVAMLLD